MYEYSSISKSNLFSKLNLLSERINDHINITEYPENKFDFIIHSKLQSKLKKFTYTIISYTAQYNLITIWQ